MRLKPWIGPICLLLLAAPAAPFNISINIASLGMPVDAGHEEITRQALADLLDAEAVDAATLGNTATDLPNGPYPVSLNDYWGLPANADWNDPRAQDLHFLRDYADADTLDSAFDACRASRGRLSRLSGDIVSWWPREPTKALFLLGHAAHIIQDSFSPAHTVRSSKAQGSRLQDVCYYPASSAARTPASPVCYHQPIDGRDRIWLLNADPEEVARNKREWKDSGEPAQVVEDPARFDLNDETEASRRAHLKHEARLARAATAGYARLVLASLKRSQPPPQEELEGFLDTIMDCSGLSRARVPLDRAPTASRLAASAALPGLPW